MNTNQAPADRALRAAAGLALLATPLVGISVPFFFLGLIPIATGIAGWCPVYKLLGLSSCSRDSYQHRREGIEVHHAAHEAHA
jgi:hypothetical protein